MVLQNQDAIRGVWTAIRWFLDSGWGSAVTFLGGAALIAYAISRSETNQPAANHRQLILVPSPAPEQKREIVNVTPQDLISQFEGQHTSIQTQKLVEAYIGKWMKVSGSLGDILGGKDRAQVTFKTGAFEWTIVFMHFNGKEWIDRLSILRRGDRITVLGQIREISRVQIDLDNCELLDA